MTLSEETKSSAKSQRALINELKGNLFEVLVARCIARRFGIENDFLVDIDVSKRVKLREYEDILRKEDLELSLQMPMIAKSLSDYIVSQLQLSNLSSIQLQRKFESIMEKDNEGDINLVCDEFNYPLSLKLYSGNSYVNTKSAGVYSFISKYFKDEQAVVLQKILNSKLDEYYLDFCHKIHHCFGLVYHDSFCTWREKKLPELPGLLEGRAKNILRDFYSKVIIEIYHSLKKLYENDAEEFFLNLSALCGFSHNSVIQFHSIYCKNKVEHKIIRKKDLVNKGDLSFYRPQESQSYFIIKSGDWNLQIRLKPMNKFTTKSYKVNCSLMQAF